MNKFQLKNIEILETEPESPKSFYKERDYNTIILVIDPKNGHIVVKAKVSYTNSMAHAEVFIHGNGVHRSGGGSASGYGYCKGSTAIAKALENCGIKAPSFGGTGIDQAAKCLHVVAKKVTGKRNLHLIEGI